MIWLGYVLAQVVFAGTMFYGFHVTGSYWWFWMVVLMATLELKKHS